MHKIDPNDMDALFREGANKHEFVYNPAAWDMMEDKLDKRDRRKTFLWFFLGLVFVIGSVFGYMHFSNQNEPQSEIANQTSQVTPETPEVVSTINETDREGIKAQEIFNESVHSSINTSPRIEAKTIKAVAQNAEVTVSKEIKEEYIKTGSEVRSSNIGAQNSENTGSLVNNEVVSVTPTTQEKKSRIEDKNISNSNPVASSPRSSNKTSIQNTRAALSMESLSKRESFKIYSLIQPVIGFDLNPKVIEITDTPIISATRYVFTGYANADFSSVGLFKKARAGYKLGFKTGIQFSDKFQFDVGLAYSHKKYGAEGEEYTRTQGWGVDNIEPTWMDAKCDVLEIPLEISYYLNGFQNDGFFINAGISSYLVNSEWYGFKYDEIGMDPPTFELLVKEINPDEITDMNYHLSGVGKLSVGYQKIVSPNMAYEVSPYIQIPFTGIGEGKINLYSTGVQFAVKFNSK